MIAALAAAALTACMAPLAGFSPCWPFAGVAAGRPAPAPSSPPAPERAGQVGGAADRAADTDRRPRHTGAVARRPLAGGRGTLVRLAAALANNLPASVSVGSLLGAGPSAYAATIGLGVGALATPQGSVATLLAARPRRA